MLSGVGLIVVPVLGSFKIWEQTTIGPTGVSNLFAPYVEISGVAACPGTIIDGTAAGDWSVWLAS